MKSPPHVQALLLKANRMSYKDTIVKFKEILKFRYNEKEINDIVSARDTVITRYQEMFSQGNIPKIEAEEFRNFLMFRNNKHWTGLQRMGPQTTKDMPSLRKSILLLVDESIPVEKRLESLIPNGKAKVSRLGKAILTPILHINNPDKYGVWNGTLEGAMRKLGIWPDFDRGASVGNKYVQLNEILKEISSDLNIDLWTLDILWWALLNPPSEKTEIIESGEDEVDETSFGLERHLHNFLYDNWGKTKLGKEWDLVEEGGDIIGYGYERITEVGRIDLLAKHKNDSRWLVIELKRGKTSDKAVGQVLRYMGWVRSNLIESNEDVEGLIIGLEDDSNLMFAISEVSKVRFMRYKIDFQLIEKK